MKMRVAGIDPSLTNTGLAKFDIDLVTWEMLPIEVRLCATDNNAKKGMKVRKNSDDLRRAQEMHKGIREFLDDCEMAFAEIPSGAQSARAALAFGIVTGVMGGVTIPLVQVMPSETKLLGVGIKNADKLEVMEWAYAKFPDMLWLEHKSGGVMVKTSTNEHLADACAIVAAGVKTEEFQRTVVALKSMSARHAAAMGSSMGLATP